MLAERIKHLRERQSFAISQAQLAKRLGVTRSSVNAWEMGISVPSTQYIVELAKFFNVSTDYLLGMEETASVSLQGLTEKDIQIVYSLIEHLRSKGANNEE